MLDSRDSYEEDLKLGFGRRHLNNSFISLNIYSNSVNFQLRTENQPPSLLNSRGSYEEDLKIRIWKMILQYFEFLATYIPSMKRTTECGLRFLFVIFTYYKSFDSKQIFDGTAIPTNLSRKWCSQEPSSEKAFPQTKEGPHL